MNNIITLTIIGLYTLVYVVIFFIQKAQIEKHKSIIVSMQSFMSIFKVDEVKKYVEMRDERIIEKAKTITSTDEKLQAIIKAAAEISLEEVSKRYIEKMGGKHKELLLLATDVLMTIDPEKREDFINTQLKNNKQYFIDLDLTLNNNAF